MDESETSSSSSTSQLNSSQNNNPPTCLICNKPFNRNPSRITLLNGNNNGVNGNVTEVSGEEVTVKQFEGIFNVFGSLVNRDRGTATIPDVIIPAAAAASSTSTTTTSRSNTKDPNPCCDLCLPKLMELQRLQKIIDEARHAQRKHVFDLLDDVAVSSKSKDNANGAGGGVNSNLDPIWVPVRESLIESTTSKTKGSYLLPCSSKRRKTSTSHSSEADDDAAVFVLQPVYCFRRGYPRPGPSRTPEIIKWGTEMSEERRQVSLFVMNRALNISEILRNIFKYIQSAEDFKRFRLVSKLWRDECLQGWRGIGKLRVYIRGELSATNTLQSKGIGKCVALEDLMSEEEANSQFYKMREVPFKNYKFLEPVKFPLDPEKASEVRFWVEIGPTIKHLNLGTTIFGGGRYLEGFQSLFLHYCPNIEEVIMTPAISTHDWATRGDFKSENELPIENLKLKSWIIPNGNFPNDTMDFRKRLRFLFPGEYELTPSIFRMLPNLNILKIHSPEVAYELLDPLNYPTFTDQFIKLSVLEVSDKVLGNCELSRLHNYLQTVAPPLESLKIRVDFYEVKKNSSHFRGVMTAAGNSLKELELKFCCYRCSSYFSSENGESCWFDGLNGVVFAELASLKIIFETDKFVHFDFRGIWGAPALEKFSYSSNGVRGTGKGSWGNPMTSYLSLDVELKRRAPPNLEKLKSFSYQGRFNGEDLKCLGRWMPNVDMLEIGLDSDSECAQVAFESFPNARKVISKKTNAVYLAPIN